jgi:hypothetical protein
MAEVYRNPGVLKWLLREIVRRARDGRVRTNIGNVATLDDAVAAFNPIERVKGKTIICVVRERHAPSGGRVQRSRFETQRRKT